MEIVAALDPGGEPLDYMQYQWTWFKLPKDDNIAALKPYLDAGGEERGFGLILQASGLYADSWGNKACECIRLLEEALPLVRDHGGLTILTWIELSRISNFALQAEAAKRSAEHLRAIIEAPTPLAEPWVGRAMINVGKRYCDAKDYTRAAKWFTDALQWHRANAGPYARWGERDQGCHLRLAAASLCEVQLLTGQMEPAVKRLNQISKSLTVERIGAMTAYLRGLMADLNGKQQSALQHYQQAETLAKDHDRELATNVAATRARLLYKMGQHEAALHLLDTLIERYARGGMVTLVLHLQSSKRSLALADGGAAN